jgi:hypothetical protein
MKFVNRINNFAVSAPTAPQNVNLVDFLAMDLSKKVILNISFPVFEASHHFKTFKVRLHCCVWIVTVKSHYPSIRLCRASKMRTPT